MNTKKQIVKICVCAMLSAFYVGLDIIAVSVSAPFGGTIKISISGLPVIIAAMIFGPIWGGAVGFVGAFLGQLITFGMGTTTLLWVLPATLRGIIMGFLFILFKYNLKPYILCVETVISSLIVTAANTFAMYVDAKVYKYSFLLFGIGLVNRIVVGIITAVAFAIILPIILPYIKKIIKI